MQKIKKRWWLVVILSLLVLLIDITLYVNIKKANTDDQKNNQIVVNDTSSLNKQQQKIQSALKGIDLNSEYGLLVDLQDGKTLYEKNSDQRIYPASLTKVLTAITALDKTHNLNAKITITNADLKGLVEEDASVAGLGAGDVVTYEQLLYALILPSGADAANALANHLDGDTKAFVADMNTKAKAMGMMHSHFMNTTGLHDKNHYTTLQDMKRMMLYAWKNPTFRKVLTTTKYTIANLQSHPDGLKLTSTLLTYTGDLTFEGGQIIGGKSGYTPEAGSCLISIAKLNNGHFYMFLSGKAPGQPGLEHYHFDDALAVYTQVAKQTLT